MPPSTGSSRSSRTRRARLSPFEWMPLEGIPIRAWRGMSAQQVRQHGQLAPGDLDLRLLGPLAQPGADLGQHLGTRLLDRDVVQQRDRVGAHADHVVGVHADEVDADGVVAAELLADDHLGPDAVAGERQAATRVQAEHVGVVARAQRGQAGAARADACEHLHERPHGSARLRLVHTGACVCPFGHVRIQADRAAARDRAPTAIR